MKKILISLIFFSILVLLFINLRDEIKKIDEKYLSYFLHEIYYSIIGRNINEDNLRNNYESYAIQKNDNLNKISTYNFKYNWIKSNNFFFIAHRGGNILLTGENTKETFKKNLNKFNFFEVDLVLTEDNKIILYHQHTLDAENNNKNISLNIEKSILSRGWNPTYLDEILPLISKNQYLILDIKSNFQNTIKEIEKQFSHYTNQMIPQLSHFKNLNEYNVENFASPIFTSYASKIKTSKIFENAKKFNIKAITLTKVRVEKLKKFPEDFMIFTHSVDSLFEAYKYKSMGIDGFYTKVFFESAFPEFKSDQDKFKIEIYNH